MLPGNPSALTRAVPQAGKWVTGTMTLEGVDVEVLGDGANATDIFAQAIADSLNAYVPNSVANELDAFGYDATVDPDDIVIDSVTIADEDTGTVDIWWEFEAGSTFEETIWEDTLDIVSETPESLDGFIEDAFAEVGVDVESPVGDALQDAATSSFAPRRVERDARGASRERARSIAWSMTVARGRCRATSSRRRSRRRGRP